MSKTFVERFWYPYILFLFTMVSSGVIWISSSSIFSGTLLTYLNIVMFEELEEDQSTTLLESWGAGAQIILSTSKTGNSSKKVLFTKSIICSNIRCGCTLLRGRNITDNNYIYRLFYVQLSAKSLCLVIRFLPKYKQSIVKFWSQYWENGNIC